MARLIDADLLKEHIGHYYDKVIFVDAVKCLIDNSPVIEAEPVKHGRWIDNGYSYECSSCGIIRPKGRTGMWKYCPNCGARMYVEKDDSD